MISKKITLGLFIIGLGISSPQTYSGEIDKIFDSITVKTNAAKSLSSQRRNGISLGGFSTRNNIQTIKPVTFRPPSIRAGCGGIDFFAGSFSIINKDQIVQTMRGIAQGAATYAFGIAVKSICPSCAEEMSKIQAQLEKFNKMALDGCKLASNLIGDEKSAWAQKLGGLNESLSTPLRKVNSLLKDSGEGLTEGVDGAKKLAEAGLADEAKLPINITWKVIKELSLDTRLKAAAGFNTNDEAGLFFLNLIGTKIQTITTDGDITRNAMQLNSFPSTIGLDIYLHGSDSADRYYVCDEFTKCLLLSQVTPPSMIKDGLIKRINEQLQTIIEKVQTRSLCAADVAVCPDAEMLGLSSLPALTLIEKSSNDDSTRALLAEILAKDIALNSINEFFTMLSNVVYEMKSSPNFEKGEQLLAKSYIDLLTDTKEKLSKELEINRDTWLKEKSKIQKQLDMLKLAEIQRERVRKGLLAQIKGY